VTKPNPLIKPKSQLPQRPPQSVIDQAAKVWRANQNTMDHEAKVGVLFKMAVKLFPGARLQRKADGTAHIVIPQKGTRP
jgi:hypothetical protein